MPVDLMALLDILLIQVLGIIMAEPAGKELLALRALLRATSPVVLAPVFHLRALYFLLLLLLLERTLLLLVTFIIL